MLLGAGRATKESEIDLAVGFIRLEQMEEENIYALFEVFEKYTDNMNGASFD